MRKIVLLLLLIVSSASAFAVGIGPVISANTYRWRADDGNETTASWKAPSGTPANVTGVGQNLRLRVSYAVTNGDAEVAGQPSSYDGGIGLQYQDPETGIWTTITSDASNDFVMGTSTYLAGNAPTTIQLMATGIPEVGRFVDATGPNNYNFETIGGESHTYEMEWVIRPTANAQTNTYYFRMESSFGFIAPTGDATLNLTAYNLEYSGSPFCGNTGTASSTNSYPAGGTYSSDAGLAIDAATGTVDIAASSAGTHTVTYTYGGGSASTPISIRPQIANPTGLNPPRNEVFCAGQTVTPEAFTGTIPGVTYNWTSSNPAIGGPSFGTGNLPSFITANNGTQIAHSMIKLTPTGGTGCAFNVSAYRLSVNPLPTISGPSPVTVEGCAGTVFGPLSNSTPVPGTVVKWTNNNTSIGLNAAGTGNLPAFVGQNNTPVLQTANVVLTPTLGTCTGPTSSTIIKVYTAAGSISYPQTTYCPSGTIPARRTASGGGTWSASPAGLAINPATGALNLDGSQAGTYTVTYTVTGTGLGCSTVATTQVTVKPQATINPLPNPVYCSGVTAPAMTFTGTASSYTWTNSNPSIGLAASGSGNALPSFTTVNPGPGLQYAYIKVYAQGDGVNTCGGKLMGFRITVNDCGPVAGVGNSNDGDARIAFDRSVVAGPNPTSGTVRVQYSGPAQQLDVLVRDAYGTIILPVRRLASNNISIDLSSLRPGAYSVQFADPRSGVSIVRTIVKL